MSAPLPPFVALITGATRGVGRAILEAIAARRGEHHVLYLGCRNLSAGTALAASLGNDSVIPVQLDVTDSASVAAAAQTIAKDGNQLDALVNNAGVLLERDGGDLASIVEPTLQINFDSVVTVTDAFITLLRDGGQIVNVSSGAGTRATGALTIATREELDAAADASALRAAFTRLARDAAASEQQPGETPVYGLSKAAVNYYTRLIARETPRLRVNACSPGFCRTEIAGRDIVYTREPKDAALGADVVVKLLFGELGGGATGRFFKECSKPGTPVVAA
eukprot:6855799-Prymnesium_polylepis.1